MVRVRLQRGEASHRPSFLVLFRQVSLLDTRARRRRNSLGENYLDRSSIHNIGRRPLPLRILVPDSSRTQDSPGESMTPIFFLVPPFPAVASEGHLKTAARLIRIHLLSRELQLITKMSESGPRNHALESSLVLPRFHPLADEKSRTARGCKSSEPDLPSKSRRLLSPD